MVKKKFLIAKNTATTTSRTRSDAPVVVSSYHHRRNGWCRPSIVALSLAGLMMGAMVSTVRFAIDSTSSSTDRETNGTGVRRGGVVFESLRQGMRMIKNSTLTAVATTNSTNATATTTNSNDNVIAWLSTGPAKDYPLLRDRFQVSGGGDNKVVFFYRSTDEPCDGCLYQTNLTSFAESRHFLLQTAMTMTMTNNNNNKKKWQKKPKNKKKKRVKYFVFFDHDMELFCEESLRQIVLPGTTTTAIQGNASTTTKDQRQQHYCWKTFNDMLLEPTTTYPFIKPLFTAIDGADAFTVKYQSCNYESFNAYRADYLWFFYPATTHLEQQVSAWLSVRSKMYLSQRCFPYAWRVHGDWGCAHARDKQFMHRPYIPQEKQIQRHMRQVLEHTYPALGPWDVSHYSCCQYRCQVRSEPVPNIETDIDPLCQTVLQERYRTTWMSRIIMNNNNGTV